MIAKVESPAISIRSSGSIWTATRKLMLLPLEPKGDLPLAGRRALSLVLQRAEADVGRDTGLHQNHARFVADHDRPLGRAARIGAGGVEGEHLGELAVAAGPHRHPG